jgi:hypothetical protein
MALYVYKGRVGIIDFLLYISVQSACNTQAYICYQLIALVEYYCTVQTKYKMLENTVIVSKW